MNLVGKIFVVLICIMSVVFMALAASVYTSNVNWRDMVLNTEPGPGKEIGLKKQLEDARAANEALKNEKTTLEKAIESVKAERRGAVAKLESELAEVKTQRDQLEKEHANLVKSERESVAVMQTVQESLANMRKDQEGLQGQADQALKSRDESFQKVVKLTDELHQSVNELKRLKERNRELADQVARARRIAEKFDIDLSRDPSDKPPVVDGVVMATEGADLIEISIGSDAGLAKGHRLEVYRLAGAASQYLGRVEVVKTDPEKAVCKIDPAFKRGAIQKGDRVATRLN